MNYTQSPSPCDVCLPFVVTQILCMCILSGCLLLLSRLYLVLCIWDWLSWPGLVTQLVEHSAKTARAVADLGFWKGGVPLSRTFSTALVHAHEAGDACAQNDKKGCSVEPKETPWIRHCRVLWAPREASFTGVVCLIVVYTYYSVYLRGLRGQLAHCFLSPTDMLVIQVHVICQHHTHTFCLSTS